MRLSLITELAELAGKRNRLGEEDVWLSSILAEDWQGEKTAFRDVKAVAHWIAEAQFREAFATANDLLLALARVHEANLDTRALGKSLEEARAFGKTKAGSRIVEATGRAVRQALRQDPSLLQDGSFIMTQAQAAAPPVRDRSAETGSLLKAAYITPCEIVAAAALVRQESGDVDGDDLIRAIARLLGFLRVGSELSTVIAEAVSE
jgi:hypothetical protein